MKKIWISALALVLAAGVAMAAAPRPLEDEYGRLLPVLTPNAPQAVAYTGTAAQSTAIANYAVRITCTTACFYLIGANPTATSSSHYLSDGGAVDVRVTPGHKISVIQASAAGTAYITEWN